LFKKTYRAAQLSFLAEIGMALWFQSRSGSPVLVPMESLCE